MNQSQKINLFVGLGCKPMKAVVLYQSQAFGLNWGIVNVDELDNKMFSPYMYVEAIAEKLPIEEQHRNAYGLCKRYGISIEMRA